jgi:hypothetical protein
MRAAYIVLGCTCIVFAFTVRDPQWRGAVQFVDIKIPRWITIPWFLGAAAFLFYLAFKSE